MRKIAAYSELPTAYAGGSKFGEYEIKEITQLPQFFPFPSIFEEPLEWKRSRLFAGNSQGLLLESET